MKKLVIISHTGHQLDEHGYPHGWGPTVSEINYLSQYFDQVVHVACLEPGPVKGSSLPYTGNNVKFISIPTFGGQRWYQKLDMFWKTPLILSRIHKALKGATYVQIRLPMGIGVFLIPYFALIGNRSFNLWVKYANNWGHVSNSIGYRLQRALLNRNALSCPVTINGTWPNQPEHCKSFENPCLTQEQMDKGVECVGKKIYTGPFRLIFVGRVDEPKGVDLLIESFSYIEIEKIELIEIVGDGHLLSKLESKLMALDLPYKIHGFLPQKEVHQLFELSHFLILPSRSEGFPKVIAEALNYGCLPISTRVGSIPHYITHEKEGFLLETIETKSLSKTIHQALNTPAETLRQMAITGRKVSSLFSFSAYWEKLNREVFLG